MESSAERSLRESTRARRRAIGSERNPLKIKGRDGSNPTVSATEGYLFRVYHQRSEVFDPPFSAEQVEAIRQGVIPGGQL